jgi:primosomal protein N' (replication factor Y)
VIARVLPDLPAVDRSFDYLVPDTVRDQVRVGTVVRVELHGRRVRGWVVELPDVAADGVTAERMKPIAKVSSQGPPPEVVELARWAAWRWAGRWVHLLRAASPPGNVSTTVLSPAPADTADPAGSAGSAGSTITVVRLPPVADRLPLVQHAVEAGPAIVVVPGVDLAERLARRLRRDGHRIAMLAGAARADQFALAASGSASVVGTRAAVWAPVPHTSLRGMLVLDEHDEAMQAEQAPTWHARDVAVERARRAGAPCTLTSPVPSLHALVVGALTVPVGERDGWPIVEVVDRREADPRSGLFSDQLVRLLRGEGRVVCVLNRLGRSRLLACTACGQVADCDRCGSAVAQPDDHHLRCARCGTERPIVCAACGGGRFRNLRMGVSRARDELEALTGEPVVEVTGSHGRPDEARVVIGTEAVLHRLPAASAAAVAFLDLDQELLAPRYRAAEQAMTLLARAARAVGGRRSGGRLLLQTRLPDHPVVRAALLGDPARAAEAERSRREALGYPPFGAMALVSGQAAPAWAANAPDVDGVDVLAGGDGRWLVRAADPEALADYLAVVPRPPGRLRVEVDPPRA